jgi:hypothetical protein
VFLVEAYLALLKKDIGVASGSKKQLALLRVMLFADRNV